MSDIIEKTINEADIQRHWNPVRGNCSVVAAGIHAVFGGQLKAISSVPHEGFFDHVVVEVDGKIYDGRGAVSTVKVEDMFVSESSWEGRDAHWFTVDDISEDSMYSEDEAEEVAAALRAAETVIRDRMR